MRALHARLAEEHGTGDPERQLMATVLADAVAVLEDPFGPAPLLDGVCAWLEDVDSEAAFSFAGVCATLDLDPVGLRDALVGRRPGIRESIMKKTVITDVQFLNLKSIVEAVDDEVRAERAESLSGPDSAAGRDLARTIGENVARHRAERGLDLAALAERSSVPVDQLRLVEAGEGLPGLRMIWQLASGLRVPFGSLLANTMLSEAADPDFRVQRAARGRVVSTPGGLRSRALSAGGAPHGPELYDLTLAAGAVEEADGHAGETFEHIVVTAGELAVSVGDKVANLSAGDSILFRADAPHRYENRSSAEARALLIMIYG